MPAWQLSPLSNQCFPAQACRHWERQTGNNSIHDRARAHSFCMIRKARRVIACGPHMCNHSCVLTFSNLPLNCLLASFCSTCFLQNNAVILPCTCLRQPLQYLLCWILADGCVLIPASGHGGRMCTCSYLCGGNGCLRK